MTATTTYRTDGAVYSLAIKTPCVAASNGNLTLSGEQTVASVAVVEEDRVLVKDQTDATENGIYVVETGAWGRAKDFDGNRDIVNGTVVLMDTSLGELVQYQVTTANPITIGTSEINFSAVSDANITYPVTEGETNAGVTPTNTSYPELWVLRYGANTTPGTTNMTTPIQNAHKVSVNGDFGTVVFSGGDYLVTTLTWSPHVRAITTGKVYLSTANASGRTIQISDEYGRPSLLGLNTARNFIFDGQFHLRNTASNTATAWTFGGATSANYCSLATALRGVETRGFNDVYEFRDNAFLLDFVGCFEHSNDAAAIKIASGTTNTGEGIRFFGCTFGTSTTGYLIDIDTTAIMTFDFIGCSCDYKLGMNKPGNTAALLAVNWSGGHLEWDTVANAYLQNESTSTWNIDGTTVAPTAASGWPTYVVSETTGAGTTKFTNIKYVLPGAVNTLHHYVSATSVGVLDYNPNYQGGNSPAGLSVFHTDSPLGFDGIKHRELAYTAVWSGTIGNGSIVGTYTINGDRVDLWILLTWGGTTSHGAATQTLDLPVSAHATYGGGGSWYGNDVGVAPRSGTVRIAPGGTSMTLYDAPTSTLVTDAVPHTWADTDTLEVHASYYI